jgi:hypothetical protein
MSLDKNKRLKIRVSDAILVAASAEPDPPTLGVHVTETVQMSDKVGG